jgi:small conductance mechanosensitive channel
MPLPSPAVAPASSLPSIPRPVLTAIETLVQGAPTTTPPASTPPTTTPPTTTPPTTAAPGFDPDVIVDTITEGCDPGSGFLCERVYDWTGSETAADWTAFLLDKPLEILLILLVAALLNRVARRAIAGVGERIASAARPSGRATDLIMSSRSAERAAQRADTLSLVLRSVASLFIWGIAVLMVLGELGINLAPLIAGAGIVGVALGFGAQSLVKDFLSGFFMLLEDQFGVGDVVDIGEASGTVEKVTLRITTVRDINGTLWHVPNGEILRVGNKSQLWSRALLDISVAYGTDVERASAVIKETADALWRDETFAGLVMEEPEVLGLERFDPDGVTIRLTVKTVPAEQFRVERELRARLKAALESSGIEIPFPQRTVWLRTGAEDGGREENPVPAPAAT